MAGVQSMIQLTDRMTPVLQSITSAMNIMVSSFSSAQMAAESSFNAAQATAMQQAVAGASAAVAQYQEELARVQNTPPPPTPEPPAWNSVSAQPVIMSSGAERFAAEYQAANAAAQQLYQKQQAISAQARSMDVVPPGMLNDVAATANRMQSLTTRVQELNNIPIDLRTERTNNELESLRGRLSQAVSVQDQLNDAMGRMDISAANAAYQQLNSIMDSAERNIRDNITAQEDFNNSIENGQGAADGLKNKIQQFVGAYLGIQGVKMAVEFIGDATSLQNVQNEAETKLGAIMQQRMGADPAAIQGIKDLASAQQQIGVIGDEVQLMGAQQVATFLNSTESLATLIPAMNNLAVQQHGVNVSAQDMINIGNMAGKVMQGQVGALTRVGVTFDAAQEKILKYGNEQERAATLAEVITNNVSAMNAIMANTPQGQLQQMANTWGDIKEMVGAKLYPAVMRFFEAVNTNMPTLQAGVMGVAGVLSYLVTAAGIAVDAAVQAMDMFRQAVSIARENMWWLIPVIGGVTAAVLAYKGAVAAYNIVQGISNGIKTISAIRAVAHGAAITAEMMATTGLSASQLTLNAALYACPLTWIVLAIIALVAAIYIGVAAMNKFAGTSISATGVVMGAFASLGAHIYNSVIYIWNIVAAFINFFVNVWNDPISAVRILFYDLASNVVACVINMARTIENIINKIPGVEVSITAGLENFQSKIESAAAKAKSESEWKEVVKSKEFMDYSETFNAGYSAGQNLENSIRDSFKGIGDGIGGVESHIFNSVPLSDIASNTGNTAANTAAMADSMDMMDEDLKYMRDAAEQEIINRFTLAELKVDVNNNNTLKTQTDFADVNRMLGQVTGEILATAAEGGYI